MGSTGDSGIDGRARAEQFHVDAAGGKAEVKECLADVGHEGVGAAEVGGHRAYLIGDVVQSPLQLTDAGIAFITDADAAVAAQTRETLFHQMQQSNAVIGMDHFPGGGFQRITNTSPRRWQPAR